MANRGTRGAAALLISLLAAGTVWSDSITVDGKSYTDVLVYKGATSYYVKLPDEGRIISVRLKSIDESSVEINDDPYYRDDLKNRFDEVTELMKAGKPIPKRRKQSAEEAAAFRVEIVKKAPKGEGPLYGQGGAGGGGGGKGLGMARSQIQQMLSGMGMAFSPGPGGSMIAQLGPGSTMELQGTDANLTGIVVKATFTQADIPQVKQQFSQMRLLFGQAAPWAGAWMTENMALLETGGTNTKTQDGVRMSLTVTKGTPNSEISFSFSGA